MNHRSYKRVGGLLMIGVLARDTYRKCCLVQLNREFAMSASAVRTSAPMGAAAVERLMRPRSVAIIGISAKPGSAGHTVLGNLKLNKYGGEIYLVGRSGGEIEGRKVLQAVEDLPEGVDLAVFTMPAAGVRDALQACVRRKVRAVVIFASGVAEFGNREAQE